MLNTIDCLLYLPNFISKGVVLWVMSLDDKGRLSIISTCIGLSFLTIRILRSLINSSSKKQVEAPESNRRSVLSL
jgi:hypothetical protein